LDYFNIKTEKKSIDQGRRSGSSHAHRKNGIEMKNKLLRDIYSSPSLSLSSFEKQETKAP